MKRFLKCCFSLVLAVTVIFSFTACKTKISKTTTSTKNVKEVNGVSTNGGISVVYKNYLYFINGTKTNDGTSLTKNKKSAICRVKYDPATGEVNKNTYEVVVSNLVGFEDGSIHFFGDFMYYATPCAEKNYKGEVLYNRTTFMRYDLVNREKHEIYTTKQNDKEETITYSYYVVGNSLYLAVYEANNKTITSLKIGDEVETKYVIKDVVSCVMSENNGLSTTEGKDVDANNYIYYTRSPIVDLSKGTVELPQEGVRVYRVSPSKNNSKLISNNGEDVTLLCIRGGKLLTNIGDVVYAHEITGSNSDALTYDFTNAISYQTYENISFIANADGSISVLSYNKDTFEVAICDVVDTKPVITQISVLSESEAFEFVTVVTVDEVVVEDDKETTEVDETEKEKVQSLIYIDDGKAYKLEIAREQEDGSMAYSKYSQPIKLTTTDVQSSSGTLVPEVVGNYLFIYALDSKKNVYMHQVDITITENSTKAATIIALTEK